MHFKSLSCSKIFKRLRIATTKSFDELSKNIKHVVTNMDEQPTI